MQQVRELVGRIKAARRKGWLRSRPVFASYAVATEPTLAAIERRIGSALPAELRAWLSLAGFGDIDETLSFREEWFDAVESGELKGGFRFAQDEVGNFYACARNDERIVFLSRSEPGCAVLAQSFGAFLEELERRDYDVIGWVGSLELTPYAWSAA